MDKPRAGPRDLTAADVVQRQPPNTPGERQDFIDGLRALAALYVVMHHAWLQIWPEPYLPAGWVLAATGWLRGGHFAVSVFIVISGYCLTLPVVRRGRKDFSAARFLVRRAQRILPPYYLSFLFTGLLVFAYIGERTGTHWDVTLPPTLMKVALGLLLLPEFGAINHVYWSIGVECKIYLLFPLLLTMFDWFGVLSSAAISAALTFWLAYAFRATPFSVLSPHYIGLFCFGAAAAYVVNSPEVFWKRLRESRLWDVCLVGALLTTILLLRAWGFTPRRYFAVDLFVGLGATAVLVLSGRSPSSRTRRVLSWRPLVFIGTFSYSLYLIHAPLLQVVWQLAITGNFISETAEFLVLLALGVPFVLLCSWAFYWACERPFIPR